MRQLIDGILYIDSLESLYSWFGNNCPERLEVDEDSGEKSVKGFSRTPSASKGEARLVYVRMTKEEFAIASECPNITILSSGSYSKGVQDRVYESLFDDEESLELYTSVYDYAPYEAEDGTTVTPPERFGQIG